MRSVSVKWAVGDTSVEYIYSVDGGEWGILERVGLCADHNWIDGDEVPSAVKKAVEILLVEEKESENV